jgi:hypothetical protein
MSIYKPATNSTFFRDGDNHPANGGVDADNTSIMYSVNGTTVTGGELIFATTLGGGLNKDLNLLNYELYMEPGETLTICATNSNASQTVDTIIRYVELF